MVEVVIRKDGSDRLSSFFASGHAGWADGGSDVVCAAVSTLLQAAWLGLSEVAQVAIEATREAGCLSLAWPAEDRGNEALRAIVGTAALSVERIAMQYPQNVRVIYERVDG